MKRIKPIILTLILAAIIIVVYLLLYKSKVSTDIIMDCLAILTGVSFFLEYHQNNKMNEAQFVIDLNNQFINEGTLSEVEHDLEMYFTHPDQREEYKKQFKDKYALEKLQHQDFINYLVHLEGIAALIIDGALRLSAINDLMAYRYFVAVNNPVVQEFELIPYQEYYQGLIKVYSQWADQNKNKTIPMEETSLDKAIQGSRHQ